MSYPIIQTRKKNIAEPNPQAKSNQRKKIDQQRFWPLASPPKYQDVTTPQKKKLNIQFLQYSLDSKYHFSIRQTALEHEQQYLYKQFREMDIVQENDCFLQITKKLQIALKRVLQAKKQKSLQQLNQATNQSNNIKKVIVPADPQIDKMLSRFEILEKKRKQNIQKKRQQIIAQRLNKNLNRTMPVSSFLDSTGQESSHGMSTFYETTLKISNDSNKQIKQTQYTYRPMISENAKILMKKQETNGYFKQYKVKHNRSATQAAQLNEDFTFKPIINDRSRKMIPRNRVPIYQRDKKPIYVQTTKANTSKQQQFFKMKTHK